MTRFIKKVTLAVGLMIPIQSVWAACEAEIQTAVASLDNYDGSSKRSMGECSSFRDYLLTCVTNGITKQSTDEIRAIPDMLKSDLTDIARKLGASGLKYVNVKKAEYDAISCLANHALSTRLNRGTSSNGTALAQPPSPTPSPSTASTLDTAGRQQAAQTNQQQSSRSAQQQSEQSQQLAQQNQCRADQQRQGKRKTHDPAAEAHECIAIDKASSGNFGAFKNQCPYPVNFYSCNEKPRTIQGGFNWSADFDCAKQQLGLYTPKAGSSVAAHNRNTEFVHWFACKAPATPADATYVPGKGIEARCY